MQYRQTNCCSAASNKVNVNGYLIGLGYKPILSNGFFGFAEANYYAYSKANMASINTDGAGGTVSSNPSQKAHAFLLGLGYQF